MTIPAALSYPTVFSEGQFEFLIVDRYILIMDESSQMNQTSIQPASHTDHYKN